MILTIFSKSVLKVAAHVIFQTSVKPSISFSNANILCTLKEVRREQFLAQLLIYCMAISVYDSTRTHEREIFVHRAASATVCRFTLAL